MNVNGINPIAGPQGIESIAGANPTAATNGPLVVHDVLDISTASQLAAKIHQLPDVRADLVAQVKAEIQAGTYETPERIEATVDKLMDELFPNL